MASLDIRESDDYLHIETDDLPALRDAMGAELFSAFCRCFVHADRLTSLIHFVRLLEEHCDSDSVAFSRDLYNITFLAVGTLREYMKAVQLLRGEMHKADCLDKKSPQWQALLEVEKRWEQNREYVKLRDLVGFHVDPNGEIVPRGLDRIGEQDTVTIVMLDKPDAPTANVGHWYRIATEAILDGYGVGLSRDYFEKIFTEVADDMSVSQHLFDLFRQTLIDKGISFEHKRHREQTRRKK